METIKEIRCTIGRDNVETLSFADTITDNICGTITQNQSSTLCGIGKAKCLLSNSISSDCSSVPHNECLRSNNKVTKIFHNFKFTMLLQYSKECLGFIALILTTYATLLSKEPVIGGTTSPKPIFNLDSIVQEWPYGNLIAVQSKVAASELSLIYFYAPWCAESLLAKKVYKSVANLYSEEVYFAAVNCWQPNSGCRTLYYNVYKWPVLMAYLPNALSVQYNGDWNYLALSTFIDGLLIPIVRIHNKKELIHLRIANDGVIFGLFHSCDTKEFQIFFKTAIKWLENNSYETTKFAVFVGENTTMFLDSESIQAPVIKLFTPNNTIVYSNIEWTTKNIILFLKHQLTDTSIWVNLPSSKSLTMHKYLQQGPVLVMFSPLLPLSNHYLIIKQLIYTYSNYRLDLNNSVLNEYISDMKREYPVMLKKIKHFCEFSKKLQHQGTQTPCSGEKPWSDTVKMHTTNTSKQISYIFPQRIYVMVKNDIRYYEKDSYQNACFQQSFDDLDSRTPSAILKRHMQKQCVNMEKLPKQFLEKGVFESVSPIKLSNQKYKNNRTLKFLMLDSMLHHDYIRNFIGDFRMQELSSFSQQSQVLIIDNDRETLHMQKTPHSTKNALEMVNEFYQDKLSRHLKSSKRKEMKNDSSDNLFISIKEINSRQFSKVINRKNITSVVLIYTPQCSLCYIMSQTMLHISHIIKLRNVKFYKINAISNEVGWEYTMDKFPTLIVFPQNRSSDTNVFLSSLPINVKIVFSFILSNFNSEQQLNSLINACVLTKLSFAFQSCVSQVRAMINNEISHQLQKWNIDSTNQTHVLTRLKELQGIYLELLRVRKTEDLTLISKEIFKYGNDRY